MSQFTHIMVRAHGTINYKYGHKYTFKDHGDEVAPNSRGGAYSNRRNRNKEVSIKTALEIGVRRNEGI